jgi:transcriptional regulator with XRE-family HTH domain
MASATKQTGFTQRLTEVCRDMNLPEHGQQTALARLLGVTQGATKKWFNGEGYPTLDKIVAICDWANGNVNWLVMGYGPKRRDIIDTKSIVLGETIENMAEDDRQQVLDFIGYKLERGGMFAGEQLARYMKMLDAFKTAKK